MENSEKLKLYLKQSPRENRLELERFIDEEMGSTQINNALNWVIEKSEKLGHPVNITSLTISGGNLSVTIEEGVTFL